MDAKPASSPQGSPPGQGDAAVERYGPLAVRRLVKDDGRAVIVYERARPSADGEPAAER
jgi:hypothetical protein